MRIFQGFLIMVVTVILWLLPVSEAVYGFQSTQREQSETISTGAGVTTATIILDRPIFEDTYINNVYYSDLSTDTPAYSNYTTLTRELTISGLTASDSRTLTILYDVDGLSFHPAIKTVINIIPTIWILILVAFPVVSLIAIWKGRV